MAAQLLSILSFCFLFSSGVQAAGPDGIPAETNEVHSQNCPGGWQYFGGSCYALGDFRVTWWDAQAICNSFNGKLSEIETAEENDFVKNIARNRQATPTFVGGADIFYEGVWQWASTGKTIFSFRDWFSGQPDNKGGQDCLVLWGAYNYQWGDLQCNEGGYFICEIKSVEGVIVG